MTFQVVGPATLAADVATSGTFTVSYPTGQDNGSYALAMGHKIVMGSGGELNFPVDFDLTFGASSITVTNKQTATWLAGTTYRLQLEEPGKRAYRDDLTGNLLKRVTQASSFLINLGAPDVLDADGICASQSVSASVAALLNGAVGATLDRPRNVVAAWTGTAVLTVVGKDEYGVTITESSASGTSLTGKKAFKSITSVTPSANITGATVGTGDVLGLPVFVPSVAHVLKEIEDSAVATAGTFVAGIRTAGGYTATTGDVRGTYDPNSACDGAKVFRLIVALPDPGYLGIPQA